MLTGDFIKPQFTLNSIGKFRFWIAIGISILTAISICLLYTQAQEFNRIVHVWDEISMGSGDVLFYNRFVSFLSIGLGMNICMWIWLGKGMLTNTRKSKLYKRLTQTNALLYFFIVLMLVTRFAYLWFIFQAMDSEFYIYLNPRMHFSSIFYLLPLVLFLQSWYTVRMIYKTKYWVLGSLITCFVLGYILSISLF